MWRSPLVGDACVDACQDLPGVNAVARLHVERDDAARDLRAQRGLPDRLDLPFSDDCSRELAHGDLKDGADAGRARILRRCAGDAGAEHDRKPDSMDRLPAVSHRAAACRRRQPGDVSPSAITATGALFDEYPWPVPRKPALSIGPVGRNICDLRHIGSPWTCSGAPG